MMKIRQAQLDAMRLSLIAEFECEAAAHLRSRFPEKTAEIGAALGEYVSEWVRFAERQDIRMKSDVLRLLEYSIYYWPNFNESEEALDWLWAILRHPVLDGTDKLDRIDRELSPGARDA